MTRRQSRSNRSRIARLLVRIERNPTNAALFQELGRCCLKDKRFDEAELAYRSALELAPNDPWNHLYLGNLFYAREQYAEALSEFQLGEKLAPNISMPYVCIADTYHCLNDLDLAAEYYRKAVAIDPEDEIAQSSLSRWLEIEENQPEDGERPW